MMGTDIDTGSCLGKDAGIIPRFCFELFERIDSLDDTKINAGSSQTVAKCNATVEISYFEIYNEKIHDLLGDSTQGKRAPLKVREHPVLGPYVVDLSLHGVNSYEDLQGWLAIGNRQRATSATSMNDKSSRSHSIFSIILTQRQTEQHDGETPVDHSCRSKINLVDLAGSERVSQTCASGDRLREGVSINRSLLTLGKVIASLSENAYNRKKGYVPYRDSVLTWLLRESLGGNSRTTMLATISPASTYIDETLATLRYACQARTIVNRVRVNENPNERLIRELREEVENLRKLREDFERKKMAPRLIGLNGNITDILNKDKEIGTLKEQLKQKEDILASAEKSWSKRLEDAQNCKTDKIEYLRRTGVALQLQINEKQPCLVNLVADPMFSGTLLYLLMPGTIRIGRLVQGGGEYQPDIALSGPLVSQQHCTIDNRDGQLSLRPVYQAETFVNGEMVTSRTVLHHGDRIVIGKTHYFRVSNPLDCSKEQQDTLQVVDYDYAHAEITRIQEEKLKRDLDAAKQLAVQELEIARRDAEIKLNTQRINYEQKLHQIGVTLDEEKNALATAQKNTKDMEEQIQLLKDEVQRQQLRCALPEEHDETLLTPYKSNFLLEVEALLSETAIDVLKSPTSAEASMPGGVSLYNMDVMVQEATLLCRELGIHYVFTQQQVISNSSLEPMIRVSDKMNYRSALWQPNHFIEWFEQLRDYDPEHDNLEGLMDTGTTWEEDESDDDDDSITKTRISINTKEIKKQLNDSINHLLTSTSSNCDASNDALQELDSEMTKGEDSVYQFQVDEQCCYLNSIEEALQGLKRLSFPSTIHILDKMEENLEDLRTTLNLTTDIDASKNLSFCTSNASDGQSSCYSNNSSILRRVFTPTDLLPQHMKSNLKRVGDEETPNKKTFKAVRFNLGNQDDSE